MKESVIKVENLSKVYRLGEISTGTLSHDLNRWWKMKILRQEDPYSKITQVNDRTSKAEKGELVAALSDINFEVKQGEVLGIIGRNGAGKSTLLKILSRVTSPTTGDIWTKGRMASLLEVGTGFHPEMTGRENIYMNGTIMGMRKWEITRKLDEIIDFAGVAKYLDTPVKRYSSGMTVRLGFAIAAHLEPEILIVDEVLAVGDDEFQKKAIGKMQDVSSNTGRTVLFVSHNMGAVRSLCLNSIILENGRLKNYDKTETIIKEYLSVQSTDIEYRSTKENGIFIKSSHLCSDNKILNTFDFMDPITANVELNLDQIPVGLCITIVLQNINKNRIFSVDCDLKKFNVSNNIIKLSFEFPKLPYAPGEYSVGLCLHVPNSVCYENIEDVLPFSIVDKGSSLSRYTAFTGDMLVENKWKVL